jgi:hypothetical protein
MTALRVCLVLVPVLCSVASAPAVQPRRQLVALRHVGDDRVGAAFAAALREALATSRTLALAPDPTKAQVEVTSVSTPVSCGGTAQAAIAIGAHRRGGARSTQWVNVVFADGSHARESAVRALNDVATALSESAR